jgi:hypothetical protein
VLLKDTDDVRLMCEEWQAHLDDGVSYGPIVTTRLPQTEQSALTEYGD